MKVLITSGGTSEKIDAVRSISNISTGKLGSIIALKYAEQPDIENIYYVCSSSAVKPQSEKIEIIIADNVSSLETSVKEVLKNEIDIIVHCMAVSDYKVSSITSLSTLAEKIVSGNCEKIESVKSMLLSIFENSKSGIEDEKINSDMDDVILFMEPTQKIISLFQELSPKSTLVGFKLLHNVNIEILIKSGYDILTKNKCSFVLANDLKDIAAESGKHTGYLIDRNKNYNQYSNKTEIADAIVKVTINERKNKL